MRVLVTGANGFIGSALCDVLINHGIDVNRCVRHPASGAPTFAMGDIDDMTDWSQPLQGCDAVVHLAGRAHQLRDSASEPLEEFRAVNVRASLALFTQAFRQGVKRFVFISSVGVNGNRTTVPFSEADSPRPQDPYSISKLEAEAGLKRLSSETGLELVVIRPPLVYGPDAPGNFGLLIRWMRKGIPLPLGAIHNRRSMVAIGNLADFIVVCLKEPAAANQVFLVSDGIDLSTSDLLRHVARLMQRPARLIPVPAACIETMASLVGQSDVGRRLCGDLQVDIGKARELLAWSPPQTVDEGLLAAVRGVAQR